MTDYCYTSEYKNCMTISLFKKLLKNPLNYFNLLPSNCGIFSNDWCFWLSVSKLGMISVESTFHFSNFLLRFTCINSNPINSDISFKFQNWFSLIVTNLKIFIFESCWWLDKLWFIIKRHFSTIEIWMSFIELCFT